jgi:hypothetical protein
MNDQFTVMETEVHDKSVSLSRNKVEKTIGIYEIATIQGDYK